MRKTVIISLSVLFTLLIVVSLDFYSSLGVAVFVFFGIKFFKELGSNIEIRDMMILIAVLQWIIGPILAYTFYPDDQFYYMAVEREQYMSFVVFATIAFILGLYLPIRKSTNDNYFLKYTPIILQKNQNIDILFIVFGLLADFLSDKVPVSVRFVFFLLGGLRFVGLYFLFLSKRKNRNIYVFVTLGLLFVSALGDALFHELLLWLSFFIIIVAYLKKPTFRQKTIVFSAIFLFAVAIQTVKYQFRDAISSGENAGVGLFTDLVQKNVVESDYVTSDENLSAMVTRINQGWIIARIMSWTPRYEPFANGETIIEALQASFMPRFLFPDKVKAGGRTYFTRFTGKDISDNTSMGLSLLGESYANFGITGGAFFMFVIGFFYNYVIKFIYTIARKRPTMIFFLPLIFLQVVKAETDFSVIINHLFKASITVALVFWGMKQFFNIRL